jgi:hypothetical protein
MCNVHTFRYLMSGSSYFSLQYLSIYSKCVYVCVCVCIYIYARMFVGLCMYVLCVYVNYECIIECMYLSM